MAETLLYRHIVIKDIPTSQLSLLQRTLSTKRRPNGAPAGAWTRKITVTAQPDLELVLNAAYHRDLRDVLLLCPNLKSFCIGGRPESLYNRPETTEDILKALPDHLRMCAWSDLGEPVRLGLFRDLCSFFSMLEHLQLRNLWGYGNQQVIITLPRLRSLSFSSWITTCPIAQWDLPSLVWLEISVEDDFGLEELGSFFFEHGKKLEFLQLVPGDLQPPWLYFGDCYLHSIRIPLNFFRYFPLLSCFSVDPSWMQLIDIEEPDKKPAVPYENLTTLHMLRPNPRNGPNNSCGQFVRSFFVVHQNLFPRLKVISFTIEGGYIVVPMFYPWFCFGVKPTREVLDRLEDVFSFD